MDKDTDDIRANFPPTGGNAFLDETPYGPQSAGAQLLLLTTYLVGTQRQKAAIMPDANELNVPFVEPLAGEGEWRYAEGVSQQSIDQLTVEILSGQEETRAREWSPGQQCAPGDQYALWKEVERTRSPYAALALINLSFWSADELQRTCAAACLNAVTKGTSEEPLLFFYRALRRSEDPLVRDIAAPFVFGWHFYVPNDIPELDRDEPANRDPSLETSVTVHGTWARLSPDGWFKRTSALHQHLTAKASPNLFQGSNYFRWTGGYHRLDRRFGASDFGRWKRVEQVGPIDTVYAHSHGGNVALNLLASGEQARLLVLLHTPVLSRTDKAWERIRNNVQRVVVMRTRADLVMLADGLRNGSSMNFLQHQLPHRQVMPHWKEKDSWFSHGYFVTHSTWMKYDLANEIRYEHSLA